MKDVDLPPVRIEIDSDGAIRTFESGATRDSNEGKLEYARFFSPAVLKARAEYMHRHRRQSDGTLRDPDNWKKGIPFDAYIDSMFRHFFEIWEMHDGDMYQGDDMIEALCALMFNAEGYLYELLKQ